MNRVETLQTVIVHFRKLASQQKAAGEFAGAEESLTEARSREAKLEVIYAQEEELDRLRGERDDLEEKIAALESQHYANYYNDSELEISE